MVSVKMGLGENPFSPPEMMGPSEQNVWIMNLVILLDITSITLHVERIHILDTAPIIGSQRGTAE